MCSKLILNWTFRSIRRVEQLHHRCFSFYSLCMYSFLRHLKKKENVRVFYIIRCKRERGKTRNQKYTKRIIVFYVTNKRRYQLLHRWLFFSSQYPPEIFCWIYQWLCLIWCTKTFVKAVVILRRIRMLNMCEDMNVFFLFFFKAVLVLNCSETFERLVFLRSHTAS